MLELIDTLTKSQKQKLVNSGFNSIYDVITHFPRSVRNIQPFATNFNPKNSEVYLFEGVLEKVEYRNGKKKFLELTFKTPLLLKVYYFSVTNYTSKWLTPGSMFQGLVSYRKGFWSAIQLSKKKEQLQENGFVLGSAIVEPHLQVIYPEKKQLANSDFINIHQLLDSRFYVLNFQGLVPENDIFPMQFNLEKIHKPNSLSEYNQSYHTWLKFKVFLKLCVYNYYNQSQIEIPGKLIDLDLDYVKNVVKKLPFELTVSQKTAIWDILKDLSINY